jgi:hypothetical protein
VVDYPDAGLSQVAVIPQGTSQMTWLGNEGHVTPPKYSFTYSGGCEKMSCTLPAPATYRAEWMLAGSAVSIFRGGHQVWAGQLDEPDPGDGGWSITGAGVGVQGADFEAVFTDTWPTGEPDEFVNNAISRGLPWVNPGIGTPSGIWLGQPPDSGAQYVDAVLNTCCTKGGLGWYVNSQPGGVIGNSLALGPLPTTVNRILVAVNPVARTLGGDVRAIFIRYQATTDSTDTSTAATYALTSVTNTGHSGREYYLDLSNAGVMTQAAAQGVASALLKIYQNASFAGSFTVMPGQLLTTGGVPVDLGCEQAGTVVKLILADFAYGGGLLPAQPAQFITGAYEWDDAACQATMTPFQAVDQSLASLLSATSQTMVPVTSS